MKIHFLALFGTLALSLTGVGQTLDTGSLDTTYVPKVFYSAEVQATAATTGGKLYVGGNFDWINGQPADWLARLNADGTVDTSFNPQSTPESDRVLVIAPQADGKVLVGFFFMPRLYAMANTATTAPHAVKKASTSIQSVVNSLTQGTTSLRLSGNTQINNLSTGTLTLSASSTSTLTLSGSTGSSGTITVNPLPIFWPGGNGRIIRLNADGSTDTTFNSVELGADWSSFDQFDLLTFIKPGADGKILIGGSFQSVNGAAIKNLARLNSDGTVDSTFITTVDGTVTSGLGTSDGGTVIGGAFTRINKDKLAFGLAKLKANGKRDTAFVPKGKPKYPKVSLLSAGPNKTILAATSPATVKTGTQPVTSLDVIDGGGAFMRSIAKATGKPSGVAMYNANTIVLVASTDASAMASSSAAARLQAPASVTFVSTAKMTSTVKSLSFRPNGLSKVRTGWQLWGTSGTDANATPSRTGSEPLNLPNTVPGFPAVWVGKTATVSTATKAADDSLFVTGSFCMAMAADGTLLQRNGLAKLDAKGFADSAFAPNLTLYPYHLLASTGGGVIVQGWENTVYATDNTVTSVGGYKLLQLKADGSQDASFAVSTEKTLPVLSALTTLIHDSKGRIILGGQSVQVVAENSTTVTTPDPLVLKRLNADGSEDTAFAPKFALTSPSMWWDNAVSAVHVTADVDGALLVGGHFDTVNDLPRSNVVRLLDDGSVDASKLTAGAPQGFTNIQPRANGGYLITAPNLQHSLTLTPVPVIINSGTAPVLTASVSNSAIAIGPIYPPSSADGKSPFLGTDSTGATDGSFASLPLVPSSNLGWWWGYGYGVKFVAALKDGSWVAMTKGLNDKEGKAVSLVIVNPDGTLRSGYSAPELGSAPNQYGGAFIWWGPREPADFVQDVIVLSDNSIILVGSFWSVNGEARCGIAKLKPVPLQLFVNSTNVSVGTLNLGSGSVLVGPGTTGTINIGIGSVSITKTGGSLNAIVGSGPITVSGSGTLSFSSTASLGNIPGVTFGSATAKIDFSNLDWTKWTASQITVTINEGSANQQAFADAAKAALGDRVTIVVIPATTTTTP